MNKKAQEKRNTRYEQSELECNQVFKKSPPHKGASEAITKKEEEKTRKSVGDIATARSMFLVFLFFK